MSFFSFLKQIHSFSGNWQNCIVTSLNFSKIVFSTLEIYVCKLTVRKNYYRKHIISRQLESVRKTVEIWPFSMLNQRTKDFESRGTTIKGHVRFEMLIRPSSSSLSSCFSGVCMYGGDLHTHNQCGPKCVNQFADHTYAHISLSLLQCFETSFWHPPNGENYHFFWSCHELLGLKSGCPAAFAGLSCFSWISFCGS